MFFIDSNNITVFPSDKRAAKTATYISSSRAMTEANLLSLVNKLLKNKSFVISDIYNANEAFIFCIQGYLFTIKEAAKLTNSINGKYLKASITLTEPSDSSYIELEGIDEDSKYNGLELEWVDSDITNDNQLLLLMFDASKNQLTIPEKSKLNLIDQIIDGGQWPIY